MRVISDAFKASVEDAIAEVDGGASIRRVALERARFDIQHDRHAQTAALGPK